MNHEILRDSIPEFVADRLAPDLALELEAHLRDCNECAEMVETWREIAKDLREDGARIFEEHPTPAALRAHARGSRGDPAVARHLERCASCALEVEAWQGVRRRPLPAWALTAAALFAGAAILFTVAWVFTNRGTPRQSATWTGSLSLVLVGDSARGEAARPVVQTTPDRPYVLLGAQFALPADLPPETKLTVRIADASGRAVWEAQSRAGDARVELNTTGTVPWLVPAQRLGPGSYSIDIASEGRARLLLHAIFEVRAGR